MEEGSASTRTHPSTHPLIVAGTHQRIEYTDAANTQTQSIRLAQTTYGTENSEYTCDERDHMHVQYSQIHALVYAAAALLLRCKFTAELCAF